MRIFVTGGTGFIGSYVLRHALRAGHEIVALRRAGTQPRIALPFEPEWLEGDLEMNCSRALKTCDAVMHLAAAGVSPQKADWETLVRVNVWQTQKFFLQVADAGINRWIVAGTCLEYGRSAAQFEAIPANAPLEPVDPYGASKAAAFVLLHALALEKKAALTYLRLFSVYGEGQFEGNFWPSLKKAALEGCDFPMTDGAQVRDFFSVENVADVLVKAAEQSPETAPPLVVNIGGGNPQSLREFAEQWWRAWGAPGKLLIGALPQRSQEIPRLVPEILP